MNQTPHTHQIEIKVAPYRTRCIRITYGDQTTYLWTWAPGWRSRLERKVKRIVAEHDRGSLNAHLEPAAVAEATARKHNDVLAPKQGRYSQRSERAEWGSPLLKPKKQEQEPAQVVGIGF